MSRKYPISKAFQDDPPPWPWYTERQATKVLGVPDGFLAGLANQTEQIRACKRVGKTGRPVLLFSSEDVDALAVKMVR